jgi:hypothetical protein
MPPLPGGAPKNIDSQRDFSAGEIDVSVKRADQSPETSRILKTGVRQMANMRIRNGGAGRNRPARTALYLPNAAVGNVITRTEEVTIAPGVVFRFEFTNALLRIYDTTGTLRFTSGAMGWVTATLAQITYGLIQNAVYVACPGTQPQVFTWNGGNSWSGAAYAETVSAGGQKRTFFYRLSPKNVTMQPSAVTGNGINLLFSSAICVAGMVGTRMRFCGRQVLITAFVNSTNLTANVIEPLPPSQGISTSTNPALVLNIGDEVEGQTTGARGIVVGIGPGNGINVQLLSSITSAITGTSGGGRGGDAPTVTIGFSTTEVIAGPGGSVTATGTAVGSPLPIGVWDEEIMNAFRGWPGAVFADQGRLGFANFPPLPRAIGWSAILTPTDLYPDGPPEAAMLEFVPDNTQVLFVVPGPESSEFVFCTGKLYYVPITPANPLASGKVQFQILSGEGCAQVQPRAVAEVIVYINSGLTSVMAVVAPGAYYRPYETRNLSELHAHLIKSPVAIAIPNATATFEERYAYVLNSDGTLAVGKYTTANGQIVGSVGWVPWSAGNGTVDWVSARDAVVLFSTRYSPNGITPVTVIEQLDDTRYLDGNVMVNALPAALAAPGGKGPLWWLANGSVDLMDQGTRMMGTYLIDANGFIIPQNNAGENLAAATLVAGQLWIAMLEPFVPAVQPGQDVLQRMRKRRMSRAEIYVKDSTGFLVQTLYTEQQGRQLPAPGTPWRQRRIPAWNQDDDPTLPPHQFERAYAFKPTGRAHDPRLVFVKDTPGPLEILEIGIEVAV